MKKYLLPIFLITLAAVSAGTAQAHDDRGHDHEYSRIEDRMGDLDARIARLAAVRDRFGSDQHLRREINLTADAMQEIRYELRRRDTSPDRIRAQTDRVSLSLSHLEAEYRDALSFRPRHREYFRRGY